MISVQDWAQIRYLHTSEGLSRRAIAARLGLSRDTVARAIASESPPKYERVSGPSAFDPFEPHVRALLTEFPSMPASVIAERVGWSGSPSWFRKKIADLRPEYAPKDPADRLEYRPGDQAQCDLWFPPTRIPLGAGQFGAPPVLVMVASFSRFITAMMIPTRTTADLLAGMWALLSGQLGMVPRRLLWDNESGIGKGGHLATGVSAFTGMLGTRIVQCKPFDPESKGIVERVNGYLETSFLPGRAFASPADFNSQAAQWIPIANTRRVRRIAAAPAELIGTDRARMTALPPIAPTVGFAGQARLPRDYYLRVLGNDYSIDPTVIGRMIDIRADLNTVTARCDGLLVGSHRQASSKQRTITDPAHVDIAARLREAFGHKPSHHENCDGLVRDLADYDAVFGVDFDDTGVA
ncbi:transcriptional regulator with XRE-family HTH domain [Nocardia goodfellowii]|uniref:Transcriptional regulator with XRE-family HTH domain n=1 Tax=Nocardia goodfellowii TaxID=882446 RepID=A0ABS4QI01_9NOCA|nr:IS21 family transposase [Nocardia goodfellowii]MBP2191203.1 transcriptional regulator with XRE-family HTH domain [Nocardia goodfellowii]